MRLKASVLLLILVMLSMAASVFAQEEEENKEGKHYFLNLSLYYPVSINKTKHDRVNINLSLVYGRVGYVSGFDLSIIGSAISHNLEGVQICGLASIVGESGQGMQSSGLANVTGMNFTGFQLSGLMNVVGENLSGFQMTGLMNVAGEHGSFFQAAGLANIVGEKYSGIQLSGVFNVIGERCRGAQVSALFNVVGEDLDGFQAAGLFNAAGNVLKGFQLSVFNVAAHSKGVQVGLANASGISDGVQIGLVNYTKKENNGVPFGLVNLAKNGLIKGALWGGDSVAATAGVKFIVNSMYSIVSLGAVNLDNDISESLTYGFHYGIHFPIGHLTLGTDLGYRYRDNKSLFRQSTQDPDQHIFEARLILEIPLSEHLTLILGGGAGHNFDTGKPIDTGRISSLIVAGIEFF